MDPKNHPEVPRIAPDVVLPMLKKGLTLVCAYDDPEKWSSEHPPGSIPLAEFERRLPSLGTEAEIVFYCG